MDRIVPLSVKRISGDVEISHFLIRNGNAFWIEVFVQFKPRPIVLASIPVARATAAIPP